jgi:diguanylate cyclase
MTIHDSKLAAMNDAVPDPGPMQWFTQIGTMLVAHRLPPLPDVYELLWRYVRDEDHALSLAVDRAIAAGDFNLGTIAELRQAHCGELGAKEVSALVEAAHGQAEALSHRIEAGRTDLADYGRAIADGGARLEAPLDAAGLAAMLDQLGAATAKMQAANARLEGELARAAGEARALAEKLGAAERAAITDPLTGVLNRRGIIEQIERLQSETRAAGTKLALAMVDIDHFKRVNDRFGHAIGDDILRFVARHLADSIASQGGKVGRFGGEEFIALLPDHDAVRGAMTIDRARAQLAGQIIRNAADGSSLGRVSFSAGVAADRHDDNCDQLIERADRALYSAKRMGRDRVVPDR